MQAKVNSNLMSDTLTEAELLLYTYLCQVTQLSLATTSDQGGKIVSLLSKMFDFDKATVMAALLVLTVSLWISLSSLCYI